MKKIVLGLMILGVAAFAEDVSNKTGLTEIPTNVQTIGHVGIKTSDYVSKTSEAEKAFWEDRKVSVNSCCMSEDEKVKARSAVKQGE